MHVIIVVMAVAWFFQNEWAAEDKFFALVDEAVVTGRMRFFSTNPDLNLSAPYLFTLKDIGFGSLEIILRFVDTLWVHYVWLSLVCGAVPLTFYFATKSFIKEYCDFENIEDNGCKGRKTLYVDFNQVKILKSSINNVWSEVVLLVIFDEVLNIVCCMNKLQLGKSFIPFISC